MSEGASRRRWILVGGTAAAALALFLALIFQWPIRENWWRRGLDSPDPQVRVEAKRRLEVMGSQAYIDWAIDHPSMEVLPSLIETIEEHLRQPAVIRRTFLGEIERSPRSTARQEQAIQAIGWLGVGAQGAVATLTRWLLAKESLRKSTSEALRRVEPNLSRARELLVEAFETSKSYDRREALECLALLDLVDERLLPALARAFAQEQHRYDRLQLAKFLVRFSSLTPKLADFISEVIQEGLSAPPHVQSRETDHAMDIAAELGQDAAATVPLLVQALSADYQATRQLAAKTLGRLGPVARDAVPALLSMAQSNSLGDREAALKALGRIDAADPRVRALLEAALQDRHPSIRRLAASSLATRAEGDSAEKLSNHRDE